MDNYELFDVLWEQQKYEEAIALYERTGRFFWRAQIVGRYFESKGWIERAIAEYEFLMESYLQIGEGFLPLPGGHKRVDGRPGGQVWGRI